MFRGDAAEGFQVYAHPSKSFPIWLLALLALLLIAGALYLWRGLVGFLESGGNIAAHVTQNAVNTAISITETAAASAQPTAYLSFLQVTPTPRRPCIEFYVTVTRARVRECPGEDCATIERPYQNNIICVYGPAPNAPDWYEVNLEPDEPLPRIGYMHNSVIYPMKPTKRPTQTPSPSPTDTPRPQRHLRRFVSSRQPL